MQNCYHKLTFAGFFPAPVFSTFFPFNFTSLFFLSLDLFEFAGLKSSSSIFKTAYREGIDRAIIDNNNSQMPVNKLVRCYTLHYVS